MPLNIHMCNLIGESISHALLSILSVVILDTALGCDAVSRRGALVADVLLVDTLDRTAFTSRKVRVTRTLFP